MLEGVQLIQVVLVGFLAFMIGIAPVACWAMLVRCHRVQRAMLDELKMIHFAVRKQGQPEQRDVPQSWKQPVRKG